MAIDAGAETLAQKGVGLTPFGAFGVIAFASSQLRQVILSWSCIWARTSGSS